MDMCDLPRTTGSAIATAIRNSLQNTEAYNTMTTKQLSDFAVSATHANAATFDLQVWFVRNL